MNKVRFSCAYIIASCALLMVITLWVPSAQAMRAIFFQPQLIDMSVPERSWATIFSTTRSLGFDTLVFQWSEYGTTFSQGHEQSWLAARVNDASNAGLKIVMGLYADPDMFAQADAPNELMQDYLLSYLNKNRRLAEHWLGILPNGTLKGWYLPLEIDDRRWRDTKALEILTSYLSREVKNLSDIHDLPVYLSTFFRANMSPRVYRDMLDDLQRRSDIRIWVQDGRGTSSLTNNETQLYLHTLENCQQPAVAGVVYEIFRQSGPDQAFKAERLPAAQRKTALRQTAPCGLDTVMFSLRYVVRFDGLQ